MKVSSSRGGVCWQNGDGDNTSYPDIPGVYVTRNKMVKKVTWQQFTEDNLYRPPDANHLTTLTKQQMSHCGSDKQQHALENTNSSNLRRTSSKKIPSKNPPENPSEKSPRILLKDLCEDDKMRVASLIMELAKIGDERDHMLKQLSKERGNFEEETRRLTEKLDNLTHDHKQVLHKMMDCQHLLSIYQYLLQNVQAAPHSQEAHTHPSEADHMEENLWNQASQESPPERPVVSDVANQCDLITNSHSQWSASVSLLEGPTRIRPNFKKSASESKADAGLVSRSLPNYFYPAKYVFKTTPSQEPLNCSRTTSSQGRSLEDLKSPSCSVEPFPQKVPSTATAVEHTANGEINENSDPIRIGATRGGRWSLPSYSDQPGNSESCARNSTSRDPRLRNHRLSCPLQNPLMSSTQKSSDFSGSVCSQNTVKSGRNVRTGFDSCPATLDRPEKVPPLAPNSAAVADKSSGLGRSSRSVDISQTRSEPYGDTCDSHRKIPNYWHSLYSSMPAGLLRPTATKTPSLPSEGKSVLGDKTNTEHSLNTSLQSNASKSNAQLQREFPSGGVDASQFCQMRYEERRNYLVQQRQLLHEERSRLMSILSQVGVKPPNIDASDHCEVAVEMVSGQEDVGTESGPNKENHRGFGDFPSRSCLEKPRVGKNPSLQSVRAASPCRDGCSRVISPEPSPAASVSSKESSLCLADLVDSIEAGCAPHHTTHHDNSYHDNSHHTNSYHDNSHHTNSYHDTPHHSNGYHSTHHSNSYHDNTTHHTNSHHDAPHHTNSHHDTPHHTNSHHDTPHHTNSHHDTPHHTNSHHDTSHITHSYHDNSHHTNSYRDDHPNNSYHDNHHTNSYHDNSHHTNSYHNNSHHTNSYRDDHSNNNYHDNHQNNSYHDDRHTHSYHDNHHTHSYHDDRHTNSYHDNHQNNHRHPHHSQNSYHNTQNQQPQQGPKTKSLPLLASTKTPSNFLDEFRERQILSDIFFLN
ncbi:uncharacterized protein LOC115221559 [Argonauta hians]